MILITRELTYITSGIYSGKTALSVILWFCGTILLACTTAFSFINITKQRPDFYRQIMYGLIGSCILYLASCIAQYGIFFNGPAGISLPVGILFLLSWTYILSRFPKILNCMLEKEDWNTHR